MQKGERKQFCPNGHDTFIYGRNKWRVCNGCVRPVTLGLRKSNKPKQFCPKGHDTFVVGRNISGRCNQCHKNYQNLWNNLNPDKIRARSIKKTYGISIENYIELFENQNGKCAICKVSQLELGKPLYIDHDHSCCSGRKSCGKCIRGLLCHPCNILLGVAKNNENILQNAISYLMRRIYV